MNDQNDTKARGWLEIELEDDMDEELEQVVDDVRVPPHGAWLWRLRDDVAARWR